jgi:hypothetical protein
VLTANLPSKSLAASQHLMEIIEIPKAPSTFVHPEITEQKRNFGDTGTKQKRHKQSEP